MYLLRPNSPSHHKSALILALAAVLACYLPAASAEGADSAKTAASTASMLENILSKEGISFGGAFRSQYLHSSIGGPGTVESLRSEESVEYTSVDFDIRARPNTATQGRLIIRMHQDWRNFFSDIGNPINTRWLSIDGKVKEMFRYNAGDFRQRYSPLTLYAPDFVVLHEPGLFAGQRQEAMDEAFLGNNDRLLQGVNLNFDAALDRSGTTLLEEVHLNVLGARLRNVETKYQNGAKPTNIIEMSPVEKFLAATNADLVMPLGASIGGSYLYIFDKKGTYQGTQYAADSVAQKTGIFAGRLGFDLDRVIKAENWKAGLSVEYAKSADDSTRHRADTSLISQSIDGSALFGRLHGEFKSGNLFGIRVGVDYIRNEALYRNELAQTPSFVGERIMNIENDSTSATPAAPNRTNDVRARNYSTYDAMYGHVFKFAPSANATNLWQKGPFSKNSYTHQIMTQGELAAFAAQRADTALQLVMPFGPATPNRIGLRSDATVSFWMDRIEIQAVYAALENVEGVRIDSARTWSKTKFSQAGGGLKLEVGSMVGLSLPLTLSGSFIRSGAENSGANDTAAAFAPIEVISDFINVGAQYSFWKRFALLAGYQQISTTTTTSRPQLERKKIQTHMAGGLDYKVAAGAHLLFSIGQIDVDNPTGTNPLALDTDFSQLQTDLFLTVHF
ncbi:MAG: hypothetical protein ABIW76_15455 [Fibrobacteria bacterium]